MKKRNINSQYPYLVLIAIVAIIAVAVIVLSSRQTLIVDEEGNLIGEAGRTLNYLRTQSSVINPNPQDLVKVSGNDLKIDCGNTNGLVEINDIIGGSSIDPRAVCKVICSIPKCPEQPCPAVCDTVCS